MIFSHETARTKSGLAIRRAAVAGQFYPADPGGLRGDVRRYLSTAVPGDEEEFTPKALIAPHAGYMASGPVAGSAYACLASAADQIRRIILLGPAHYMSFRGLAASSAGFFESPLGLLPLDAAAHDRVRGLNQIVVLDAAHLNEHSLEVQLPFLQVVLREFKLVPLLVGEATPEEVGEVLDALWGGNETCVVVSSDLSHYLDYSRAQAVDAQTARMIEALDWESLKSDQACGAAPIRGLLRACREHGLHGRTVDLRNSGDTCGMPDRVVGYGAFAFQAEDEKAISPQSH